MPNVARLAIDALTEGGGVFRLAPTWVPRSFLQPGRRLKLRPCDYYALGTHREEFSLPDDGAHMVNGSLDGNWYYSQGGTIDLSLSRDGEIRGTFNIALSLGEMAPGEPVVFEASEEAVPLGGEFSGSWVLNCHSRLPGHGTTIPGGDFCENLQY